MESRSFAEILSDFLEEKTPDSPLKNAVSGTSSTAFTPPLFTWHPPNLTQKKKGYPPPEERKRKPAPPPTRECEIIHAVERLESPDFLRVQVLIRMGATEFSEGISLPRLKKAHRRLVKTLHPDHHPEGLSEDEQRRRHSQFLLLQEAYEQLQSALKKLNDSTRDSESASGPGSRRQDAA